MFKIKSLQYKDLILNSTGCRKSNQLLRQPLFSFKRLASGVRRYRVMCSTFNRYCFGRRISEEPAFRTSLTLIRARARTLRGAPRGRRHILQRTEFSKMPHSCAFCAHVYPRVFGRKLEVKLNGAISDVQFKPSISDSVRPVIRCIKSVGQFSRCINFAVSRAF